MLTHILVSFDAKHVNDLFQNETPSWQGSTGRMSYKPWQILRIRLLGFSLVAWPADNLSTIVYSYCAA